MQLQENTMIFSRWVCDCAYRLISQWKWCVCCQHTSTAMGLVPVAFTTSDRFAAHPEFQVNGVAPTFCTHCYFLHKFSHFRGILLFTVIPVSFWFVFEYAHILIFVVVPYSISFSASRKKWRRKARPDFLTILRCFPFVYTYWSWLYHLYVSF